MNPNFSVIGLNRLGIKLKPAAPKKDALSTRPSELVMRSDRKYNYMFNSYQMETLSILITIIMQSSLVYVQFTLYDLTKECEDNAYDDTSVNHNFRLRLI